VKWLSRSAVADDPSTNGWKRQNSQPSRASPGKSEECRSLQGISRHPM